MCLGLSPCEHTTLYLFGNSLLFLQRQAARDAVSEELKSWKNNFAEEKNIRIETQQRYDKQSKQLEDLNEMKSDLISRNAQQMTETTE